MNTRKYVAGEQDAQQEPTITAVTIRAPSSTARASRDRGSSLTLGRMNAIPRIAGEEKVTAIYGQWPTFHDAEVLSLACDSVDSKVQVTVVLKAPLVRVSLRFHDCVEVRFEDFRRQNVLFALAISDEAGKSGPTFQVTFDGSCGLDGGFGCRHIDVLGANPQKPNKAPTTMAVTPRAT